MNIPLFKKYIILLFVLVAKTIIAQENLKEINFKHISYKEGLVQSPISNFLQDDKGFIWFGNLKGLTRYDGYEFKTFISEENDKNSISNNRVNKVFQDSEKNLWVGTANGVNLYNRDLETFRRIDILEIKGGRNYISSIVEDHQKNIWIGTFGGLKKLNKKTLKLEDVAYDVKYPAFKTSPIFSLFLDKNNHIWAGTKQGILKFNPLTGLVIPLPQIFKAIPGLINSKVLITRQDFVGNLWFGTEVSGAYQYKPADKKIFSYSSLEDNNNTLSSNWVKDILIYDDHTVWFATRNGISILNTTNNNFTNLKHDPLNPNSLNDNAIWSFMKDKASCVWVGTFAGGINFYYAGNSNFQNIGENIGKKIGLNHILVNAVTEDSDGSLWVGTFGGGLNHINREEQTSEYYTIESKGAGRPSNGIKSLADDGKGNLWIGSLDGLSLFNKKTKEFKYFNFSVRDGKLSENLILTVLPDGDGAWVGTNGGGLRYILPDGESSIFLRKNPEPQIINYISSSNIRNNEVQKLPNGYFSYLASHNPNYLSDNFVTALLKDEKNNLWIGTQNGLNYYETKSGKITKLYRKVRDTKFQISNSNITIIFKDSKNRLWIGTEGGGLNYFDEINNRFYAISKNLGLSDDVIHSIVEDNKQNLWLSTDLGLYKLNFKNFRLPFSKDDLLITSYSGNDGLISNQFSTQAGIKLKTNEIVFGGINGLSIFYPEKIIKNQLAPHVALTEVLINNKEMKINAVKSPLTRSISETQHIVIRYDQANLSFKYAALNFINPENNQYAYKLEGLPLGDEWQNTGKQRVVNFANLAPGTYYFKVKAANNDGIWSDFVRTIKIEVLPPWWRTWWASLLYFVIVAAIFTIIANFLRNRARLKRDLYLEHMHNERQQELYQMKLNFFTNISHEIRTPLTLILGPLEKIISNNSHGGISKQLELIKNNADRLMKLVTELLDFRKAEEGHMKIQCAYQDIIPFCEEIFESFKSLAQDKNIAYEFLTLKEPTFIYFDRNQLEKVIINLLSNAFKFTDENGKIIFSIEARHDGKDWVDLKVTDNGKGIPEDIQDKLFESFFQVDDGGRQNIGSGIGLALSKSIVELHKGEITVSSHATQDALTTFTISLKTGKDHLKESEIVSEAAFKNDYPILLNKKQVIAEEIDIIPIKSVKKYNLLIAEDNEEVRGLIADTLKDQYNIIEFSNGIDALAYMQNEIPDLIISDIMMPGMDGLELCQKVKITESTNHIPFILLTARASVSNQVDGLAIGADAYISKPFSLQILMLNIKNLLRAQEVMREKFSFQLLQPSNLNITSPEEKFLQKLKSIIEEKMIEPDFDVNVLVNEIGMSRTVLYKKVQALTNYSVADLIKQMRLKRAAELFKVSTFSVAEVAYMSGFNDRKHFSKEFKKQYQVSPSEFIQSLTPTLSKGEGASKTEI